MRVNRFNHLMATSGLLSMSNVDTGGGNQGGGGWFSRGGGSIWDNKKPQPQPQPQPQNPQQNQNPSGGGGDNNNQNPNLAPNTQVIDDIWNEPKDQIDPNARPAPQNQSPQNQQQPDPKAELKRHLEDMGIGDFELTEQEIQAFRDGGNINEIFGRVNARIQQGYVKLLSNVNTLIDKRVSDAVKDAVKQSTSLYQGEQLREALHEALPFTKDATISPLAETVFRRFLEKPNATKKQALDYTKEYFKRMHLQMDPDYTGYNEKNSNTRQNYRGAPPPGDRQGKPAGDTNEGWLSVLNGTADRSR